MRKSPFLMILLTIAYILLACVGFLSGMFSESVIGSTRPMASVLANVIVWFGVVVGFSPVPCLIAAGTLREKPAVRRIVLTLPFILLAVQLALGCIADML